MVKKLIKIDHNNKKHKNVFIVNWTLGNICNYSCSYCDNVLNDSSTKWMKITDIKRFSDIVIDKFKIKGKKEVYFEFTGGEVTYYPNLPNIIKYIKNKDCKIGIISNGSRKIEYFDKILPYLDHIFLSYHSEFADKDNFKNLIKYLYKKTSLHIRIMMYPDHFEECEKLGMDILQENPTIPISFQGLLENLYSDHVLVNYSKKQLKRLDDLYNLSNKHNCKYGSYPHRGLMKNYYSNSETEIFSSSEYILKKMNKWKNWLCWSGLEQIVVTAQGDVFRAWCCQDWLGNIFKTNEYESVKFPKHPTFCLRDTCHCDNDITLHKQIFEPL